MAVLGFGLPVWLVPDKVEGQGLVAGFYNRSLGSEKFKTDIKPVLEKVLGGALRLFSEHVFEGNFYADPGKTTLYVRGSMPEGCTIHQLNEAVRKMEQYVSQFEEVEQFETRVTGYNNSSITIHFTPDAEKSSFPYLLKSQVYQIYLNYNFIGPSPLSNMVQKREIDAFNQILPLGFTAQKPVSGYFWSAQEKKQYGLLLLIVVIIYFITAILFESLLKPLAVISLIPLSFIGVFLTFYLFGLNFDQGGFASFILLSGLVVNAAIYIINDFNNLVKRKNKPVSRSTWLKAFNQKIVAILLTILSTVLGLVPFVWGGQNEVFWFAFAAGAMGGLIFSLAAILVYLPLFIKLEG